MLKCAWPWQQADQPGSSAVLVRQACDSFGVYRSLRSTRRAHGSGEARPWLILACMPVLSVQKHMQLCFCKRLHITRAVLRRSPAPWIQCGQGHSARYLGPTILSSARYAQRLPPFLYLLRPLTGSLMLGAAAVLIVISKGVASCRPEPAITGRRGTTQRVPS